MSNDKKKPYHLGNQHRLHFNDKILFTFVNGGTVWMWPMQITSESVPKWLVHTLTQTSLSQITEANHSTNKNVMSCYCDRVRGRKFYCLFSKTKWSAQKIKQFYACAHAIFSPLFFCAERMRYHLTFITTI